MYRKTTALLLIACATAATAGELPFKPLFDGKSLDGWQGDKPYWSVRDGAILGHITPETRINKNRFLIYQGTIPDDFELVAEYRVSRDGNSGINYRSQIVEGIDFHALKGYQCDIDGRQRYTGSNYEERLRTTLASIGESVVAPALKDASLKRHAQGNKWTARRIQAKLGDPNVLRKHVKQGDWNQARIVARGNVLQHYINGHLMSRVVDNDTANRRLKGKLGVQVHVGPPMTIEYRVIKVRALK